MPIGGCGFQFPVARGRAGMVDDDGLHQSCLKETCIRFCGGKELQEERYKIVGLLLKENTQKQDNQNILSKAETNNCLNHLFMEEYTYA